MKKFFLAILMIIILTSCDMSFLELTTKTTTEKNIAQLSEDDLENIKKQIMNEIRDEIQNEYLSGITEIEQIIINSVKAYSGAVLGVSNFELRNGKYVEVSSGSGVIYKHDLIKSEYYMITNEHVVNGANKIQVVLADNTHIDATLIGKDAMTDLAVIKFESTRSFPTITFAESNNIQVGQFAIAIGNPLGYEYFGSVTVGVVSGLARNLEIDYDDNNVIDWVATLIQHDAAISPGNSGGGLFDINGKLIGINNMKIVQNTVSNIGFAIPVDTVKYVTEQLETNGEVIRPSLGIEGLDVESVLLRNSYIQAGLLDCTKDSCEIIEMPEGVKTGVHVNKIVPKSSAANSNLKVNDIIIKYNDVDIITFDDLRNQINISTVGQKVTLTVNRNGNIIQVEMTLLRRPS